MPGYLDSSPATTFQTRRDNCGSTVGTRLIARDAVAVETFARLAISRRSILHLSGRNGESQQTFANLHQSVYDFQAL